jgi:hypothetical protein
MSSVRGRCISTRTATSILFRGKEDGDAQPGLGPVLEPGWTYLHEKAHGLCHSLCFFFPAYCFAVSYVDMTSDCL